MTSNTNAYVLHRRATYLITSGYDRAFYLLNQWCPHLRPKFSAKPPPQNLSRLQFRLDAHLPILFQLGWQTTKQKTAKCEFSHVFSLFKLLFEGFLVFSPPFAGQKEAIVRFYRLFSLTGAHTQQVLLCISKRVAHYGGDFQTLRWRSPPRRSLRGGFRWGACSRPWADCGHGTCPLAGCRSLDYMREMP